MFKLTTLAIRRPISELTIVQHTGKMLARILQIICSTLDRQETPNVRISLDILQNSNTVPSRKLSLPTLRPYSDTTLVRNHQKNHHHGRTPRTSRASSLPLRSQLSTPHPIYHLLDIDIDRAGATSNIMLLPMSTPRHPPLSTALFALYDPSGSAGFASHRYLLSAFRSAVGADRIAAVRHLLPGPKVAEDHLWGSDAQAWGDGGADCGREGVEGLYGGKGVV